MTCVYKEYESKIKNGTGTMTTAKIKFILGWKASGIPPVEKILLLLSARKKV